MRGTHERVIVIAPAHRLRNRQRLQRLGDDFRNQRRRRLPGFSLRADEPRALVGFELLQLRDVDAASLREAEQRLASAGRSASSADIECGPQHVRSSDPAASRRRADQHGEPARRAVGLAFAMPAMPRFVRPSQRRLQIRRKLIQRLRRQFFGTEFDQQRLSAALKFSPAAAFCFRARKISGFGLRGMTRSTSGRFLLSCFRIDPGSRVSRAARNTLRPPRAPSVRTRRM